jgi:hypothetical protein
VAEQFADGLATEEALESAWRDAHDVFCEFQGVLEEVGDAISLTCSHENLEEISIHVGFSACALSVLGIERSFFKASRILARRRHSRWLRDIFGNPFRPVTLDPGWLTPTVKALAQAIYEERTFTHLPVLADALEESGCNSQDILSHFRGLGEHTRGCWAVDLLLGKS